jgi:DNA-directed RNA polymerase sigma subunit (sigma70/sigma32)
MNIPTEKFNDERLDELYRSDPGRVWTCNEIAKEAGTYPQMVKGIEVRALRKLRAALEERGVLQP